MCDVALRPYTSWSGRALSERKWFVLNAEILSSAKTALTQAQAGWRTIVSQAISDGWTA